MAIVVSYYTAILCNLGTKTEICRKCAVPNMQPTDSYSSAAERVSSIAVFNPNIILGTTQSNNMIATQSENVMVTQPHNAVIEIRYILNCANGKI